ncbi:ABC transporter substrate-binding protein [Paenibacillus roseipurpureus]|uniref:ABC transporter substrate-binding protein n=1 Tax=Paenibacillus roseopurpureus TaxID=2918901 RepID=A0AA96LJE5_9BACL|nr:ABC transporter substrate-binding protein [Paenibacillus sp. MBLB1832]WNR42825.1 ABC transporter substrate-binding protein [Paenibacillus sp. MBLB1832]
MTVVLVTATSLVGCAKDNTGGATHSPNVTATPTAAALAPVKLKWVLRIPAQKESEPVLAEVNKILKEKINATLDIQFIEAAAYTEKTKLMIAAGEDFDIMFTSPAYNFYDNVAKGAFLPMDDFLKKYAPKAYGQIPANFWSAAKVDNKVYGFPNYQIAARQSVINFRKKDMVDKYGIDVNAIKKMEDLEPALAKMKAGEGADKFIFMSPGTTITGVDTMNYLKLETLGSDGSPGVIEAAGSDYKVSNQYEHPAFVNLLKLLKSWSEKGYINKDLALVKDPTELLKAGRILSYGLNTYKPGAEAESKARYNFDPAFAYVADPIVTTSSVTATMQAISRTSKNPERAMMFLELMNTDKQLYNMVLYGLEGKNYKKTGDNSIEVIPDSGYAPNVAWMLGDQLNAYLLPGVAADIPQKTDQLNKSAKASKIMGFSFDAEPVKAELAQAKTVTDKYILALAYGMIDVDSTLATMNKELKAAGMDKIIAEKQKQLDAWVAANKK